MPSTVPGRFSPFKIPDGDSVQFWLAGESFGSGSPLVQAPFLAPLSSISGFPCCGVHFWLPTLAGLDTLQICIPSELAHLLMLYALQVYTPSELIYLSILYNH